MPPLPLPLLLLFPPTSLLPPTLPLMLLPQCRRQRLLSDRFPLAPEREGRSTVKWIRRRVP